MKRLPYEQSKDKIVDLAQREFPDFYNHDEFLPAITHWMHNPGQCPPVMPKDFFQKLLAFFDGTDNYI